MSSDYVALHVNNIPFYHPNINSNDQLMKFMRKHCSRSGSFLLRRSLSEHGAFTFSVVHQSGLKHLKMMCDGRNFFIFDKRFSSVLALTEYYRNVDIPNIEEIRNVRLLHPINCLSKSSQQSYGGSPNAALNSVHHGVHSTGFNSMSTLSQSSPSRLYYSTPRDINQDQVQALIHNLRSENNQCECGLYHEDTELIRGWEVHLNTEAVTGELSDTAQNYRVFFTDENKIAYWELPDEIYDLLLPEQKNLIHNLKSDGVDHDSQV